MPPLLIRQSFIHYTQDLALPETRAQGMGPGPQFELAHNSHTAVRSGFMLVTKPIFSISVSVRVKKILNMMWEAG